LAYVDSNVFLYPVLYDSSTDEKARKARDILDQITAGELKAYTSTLTWDEVTWVTTKLLGRDDGVNQGRKLLGFPNLEFIDVSIRTLSTAQSLMGRYVLKPRDAVHIASALNQNIRTVITDDADFDAVKEIQRRPLT
jgi:predicted nucleic acid-binding protein